MCSAVCSAAPHTQFGQETRARSCMYELNHPTPICKRLSLTRAVRGKPFLTGTPLVLGMKPSSWMHSHSTPCSIYGSSIGKRGCIGWEGYSVVSVQLGLTLPIIMHAKSCYITYVVWRRKKNFLFFYSFYFDLIHTFGVLVRKIINKK